MNGFLLIDKPSGMSSFGVVRKVRGMLQVRKAGHCGTLDPLATGLLIICLGKATKLAQFVTGQDKSYVVKAKLGQSSNTYDRDGTISEPCATEHLSAEEIEAALLQFRGRINQRAPKFSALKLDGRSLYKYARAGIEVEPPEREIIIDELQLLKFCDSSLELFVRCSKGTYIRSLVHDLGQKLGCGAYVDELRRTTIGKLSVEEAVSLTELADQVEQESVAITNVEDLLGLPTVVIEPAKAAGVSSGIEILADDIIDTGQAVAANQLVALKNGHGNILAIGKSLFGSAEFASLGNTRVIKYVRVM
jgi:tRNA pseudouridine55 synthase